MEELTGKSFRVQTIIGRGSLRKKERYLQQMFLPVVAPSLPRFPRLILAHFVSSPRCGHISPTEEKSKFFALFTGNEKVLNKKLTSPAETIEPHQ